MATTQAKSNGRGPRVPLVRQLPDPTPEPTPTPAPVVTPKLDAAVMKVQAAAPALIRNASGQIQSRSYMYVTLTAVTDQVLSLLVEEGLVWKTWPTVLETSGPGLRYRMTHVESGEFDEDTMPLLCDPTMQGLGSAVTYARRYALTAYLNLTIDEDDDGAAANTPGGRGQAPTSPPKSQSTSQQPTAAAPSRGSRPASAKQRDMLRKKAESAGVSDAKLVNILLADKGEPTRDSWENADQLGRWLEKGLGHLEANRVDAIIAGIAHAAAEGSQA